MAMSAGKPWPMWVRLPVLAVGLAASAGVGYLTAVASYIAAIMLDAAPLLAGDSTPQQSWVTPVAVGAGLLAFCLGGWLSFRTYYRHRRSVQGSQLRRHAPVIS